MHRPLPVSISIVLVVVAAASPQSATARSTSARKKSEGNPSRFCPGNPSHPGDPKPFDHLWKFVLLGDRNVGTTAIMERLCGDEFRDSDIMRARGNAVDFKAWRTTDDNGKTHRVQVWDASSPGLRNWDSFVCPNPYRPILRGAACAMLVYDVTNRESFDEVMEWLQRIFRDAAPHKPLVALVGAKSDAEFAVLPQKETALSVGEGKEIVIFRVHFMSKTKAVEVNIPRTATVRELKRAIRRATPCPPIQLFCAEKGEDPLVDDDTVDTALLKFAIEPTEDDDAVSSAKAPSGADDEEKAQAVVTPQLFAVEQQSDFPARVVTFDEGADCAERCTRKLEEWNEKPPGSTEQELRVSFIECSSKTGANVEEAFTRILPALVRQREITMANCPSPTVERRRGGRNRDSCTLS